LFWAEANGEREDETPAHHIGDGPQEDRGGTAGEVGEGENWEEESDVRLMRSLLRVMWQAFLSEFNFVRVRSKSARIR
jgi:hypothetical protein